MINDHPLIDYIEDCFAHSDVKGFKKFIAKQRENNNKVNVGISSLFKSDIEIIKDFTTLVQEDSEDEEQVEEVKGEEEEAEAPEQPVVEEKKEEKKEDKKKSALGKKGTKEVVEEKNSPRSE